MLRRWLLAALAALAVVRPAAAATDFDGSTDYFAAATTCGITGFPVSVSAWFRPEAGNGVIWAMSDGDADGHISSMYLGSTQLKWKCNGSSTTGSTFGANAWHLAIGIFIAADRGGYYDNTYTAISGSTNNWDDPTGPDTVQIGRLLTNSAPEDYFNGQIGVVAVWNVQLTTAEAGMLWAGAHPATLPRKPVCIFDLRHGTTAEDTWGGYDLAAGGTPTFYGGPPVVWWPRSQQTVYLAVGGALVATPRARVMVVH